MSERGMRAGSGSDLASELGAFGGDFESSHKSLCKYIGVRRSLKDTIDEAKSSLQERNNSDKKNGVTYGLFGSSGCGKSTLLRKVFVEEIYDNGRVLDAEEEYLTVFYTGSKHSDALYGMGEGDHGCGNGAVVDTGGMDPDIYKWMYEMNYRYDKKFNYVVMMDDVLGVKSLPVIFKAFLTYRNMNITSVVSLQYLKLCPLAVRTSLYFVILMPSNSREGVEQIVRGYMGMYLKGKNINEKMSAYDALTRDYCFFMVDNLNRKCYHVKGDYTCVELKPCFQEEDWRETKRSGTGGGEGDMVLEGDVMG